MAVTCLHIPDFAAWAMSRRFFSCLRFTLLHFLHTQALRSSLSSIQESISSTSELFSFLDLLC